MANQTVTDLTAEAVKRSADVPPLDTGSAIVSTLGYLLLMLGLLFLAYYLLKKFGPKTMGGAMGKDGPQVAGRVPLGQKQYLAVVCYREEELLLGVTEQNITLLARYQAETEAEEPPKPGAFAKLLGRTRAEAMKADEQEQGMSDEI